MTSPMPIERSVSLSVAEESIKNLYAEHGIEYLLDTHGDETGAARCRLFDRGGTELASGLGKGDIDSRRVGALYEASEHYFSGFAGLNKKLLVYGRVKDLCKRKPNQKLPISLLLEQPDAVLPFIKYRSLHSAEEEFYPLALMCPSYVDGIYSRTTDRGSDSFDYDRLQFYSTNSGIAIGFDRDEALIHGLLEAIERNATSKFLVDAFLRKDNSGFRLVKKKTLPQDILNLVDSVEHTTGGTVFLVEIISSIQVSTFCACIAGLEFEIGMCGFGCSLSKHHAASRSIYELSQGIVASTEIYSDQFLVKKERFILSRLKGLSFHTRCARFDIGWVIDNVECRSVDFDKIECRAAPECCEIYLAELLHKLEEVDREAFVTTLFAEKDCKVIHVYIKDQDHFFLVLQGATVAPLLT